MASGIPVRLSAELAQRARTAAETSERSVTEQVEHWARLGQAVEDVVLAKTVTRLKAHSHDADLDARLAFAATPAGREKALALITSRNPVRHGVDATGSIKAVGQRAAASGAKRAPTTKRAAMKKRAR